LRHNFLSCVQAIWSSSFLRRTATYSPVFLVMILSSGLTCLRFVSMQNAQFQDVNAEWRKATINAYVFTNRDFFVREGIVLADEETPMLWHNGVGILPIYGSPIENSIRITAAILNQSNNPVTLDFQSIRIQPDRRRRSSLAPQLPDKTTLNYKLAPITIDQETHDAMADETLLLTSPITIGPNMAAIIKGYLEAPTQDDIRGEIVIVTVLTSTGETIAWRGKLKN